MSDSEAGTQRGPAVVRLKTRSIIATSARQLWARARETAGRVRPRCPYLFGRAPRRFSTKRRASMSAKGLPEKVGPFCRNSRRRETARRALLGRKSRELR